MQSEPTPTDLMNAILDLSSATSHGFSQMNGRLDQVDGRLERVEGRLTSVEIRLTSVEGRLASVETRLTSIEVGGASHWMHRADKRLDALEQHGKQGL